MGTLDGPGIRFVAFLQGCNLRCGCCHNPETWEIGKGEEYTAAEIVEKAKRFKNYFGKEGGITLSGGEPLLQADFLQQFRQVCGDDWHLCAETSLAVPKQQVQKAAKCIDMFYVDCKDTDPEVYLKYTGRNKTSLIGPQNRDKTPTQNGNVLASATIPGENSSAATKHP